MSRRNKVNQLVSLDSIKQTDKLRIYPNPLNYHSFDNSKAKWTGVHAKHLEGYNKFKEERFPQHEDSDHTLREYIHEKQPFEINSGARKRLKQYMVGVLSSRYPLEVYVTDCKNGHALNLPEFQVQDKNVLKALQEAYGQVPLYTFLPLPSFVLNVNTKYLGVNGLGMIKYNNYILEHTLINNVRAVKIGRYYISVDELIEKLLKGLR